MINIRNSQSSQEIVYSSTPKSGFSHTNNSDSSSDAPAAFKRYGGKFNMVKNVFEVSEAYDIKKSFARLDKLNNNAKKKVDIALKLRYKGLG